jgi:hypothetical protein
VVQSATLRLKKWAQVGTDPLTTSNPSTSSGHRLRVDIAQGPLGTYYALQPTDFEAVPDGDTVAYIPMGSTPDANGWFGTALNASGKALVNLTNTSSRISYGKTQLRLRPAPGSFGGRPGR